MAKKITLRHTKNMTVIAFHPTQRILAAGDVTGRILIWRGYGNRTFAIGDGGRSVNNEEERPGVRVMMMLIAARRGIGMLLKWKGRSSCGLATRHREEEIFTTNWISTPILHRFSRSFSFLYNQIHLLKMPSMEILKSISGIKLPCSFPETYKGLCSGVAFDHNAGLIALRTENYSIQLYSLFDDRGISEVQVCERNHHPGDDVTVVVTLVTLSLDGSMMITTEVKLAEEGLGGLVCLKFWALGSDNRKFSLSTVVYEPHRMLAFLQLLSILPVVWLSAHLMVGTLRLGFATMDSTERSSAYKF
ncbi:hypothetical protein GH714_007512 [Hevea brasiliensis]|uniref:Uncharacterized protein n=1 Tax=Hevea brasiliensis TaxID=3981 RepID=A0A6A6MV45_HEVBR|nr:hypothetical protein GH714_007512 [Hevea brasiliensis]